MFYGDCVLFSLHEIWLKKLAGSSHYFQQEPEEFLGVVFYANSQTTLLKCSDNSVATGNGLRLVQVVEDGYEFFAKRQLVTLFSAPNYMGEFDNAGAMMTVDETLMCSFQVVIQCT